MSNKRSPYDFYPTPPEVVDKLLDNYFLYGLENESILEPCAGDGIIIQKLKERYPKAYIGAIEIDASHEEELAAKKPNSFIIDNFLTLDIPTRSYDWIITNPPFSLAQEFIEKSLKIAKNGVIMLLRLNFLGSQKRHQFWTNNPPDRIFVLSKRPSFTGNGTDSQEYAWFVWDNRVHTTPIQVI